MPVHLLAPQIAAAAHAVLSGTELDEYAEAVIAQAQEQLEAEAAALCGASQASRRPGASLAGSTVTSLALAELVLRAHRADPVADERVDSVTEAVAASAVQLSEVVELLDQLSAGDRDAASALADTFDLVVDGAFGREQQSTIS